MLELEITKSNDPKLLELMKIHYSQPKGIVGRRICYSIYYNDIYYGHIIGGSATFSLPGRKDITGNIPLTSIVNNIFYHVSKVDDCYPLRNFTTLVVSLWRRRVSKDWEEKYGDKVLFFETLVELPRTGELYKKDGLK